MITPPVALAAFAAATITEDDPLATGIASMRIGWAAFILPFIFVETPAILMQGSWIDIALNLGLAIIGVIAVTAGIVGYWSRGLGPMLRIAFTILGFAALPLGFLPAAFSIQLHIIAAIAAILLAVGLRFQGTHQKNEVKSGGN